MSSKKDRERRREERIAAEQKSSSSDQRTRLLQVAAGIAFVAVIAVVVIIVLAGGGSSGGDAENIKETAEVEKLLKGVDQNKLVLGDPNAPVELIEYGDLQCSVCKDYSENKLPAVIENQVKAGKAKIIFRNFLIIGEDSLPAGAAAIAAGNQGKGWTFLELFYRNQGEENGGYVTDDFLEAVAKKAGVPDLAKWNKERKSKAVEQQVEATAGQAETFGFTGTPSFAIKGPKTNGLELPSSSQTSSSGTIEELIESAA